MDGSMMTWVWVVLGVLIGVPMLVAALQMLAFTFAKIQRANQTTEAAMHGAAVEHVGAKFLETQPFRFVGAYRLNTLMGKPMAVMWQYNDEGTYLAVLVVPGANQITTDIVSILSWERGIGVTTATTKDGHIAPRPAGSWLQSFSGKTTSALWRVHQEAEAAIADHYGVSPEPFTLDPGEVLLQSVKRDATYILSHPWLLPVIVWRFWIGKHLLHNKTVAERLPGGGGAIGV